MKKKDSFENSQVAANIISAYDNILVKTGLQVLSGGAFNIAISELVKKREKVFFDELDKGKNILTEKNIKNENFIHFFLITRDAVQRTNVHKKIKLYANLFNDYVETGLPDDGIHETILTHFVDLKVNDLVILSELEKFEKKVKEKNFLEHGQKIYFADGFDQIWEEQINAMSERLNVKEDTIRIAVIRLANQGLIRDSLGRLSMSIIRPDVSQTLFTPIYIEMKKMIDKYK